MAIKFEFDSVTVAALERRLGRMKSEAPKVLAKALNQTAKDARRDLADKARQVYTVKIGGFNSQMKITNASAGRLEAIIKSQGRPTSFGRFSLSGGKFQGGPNLNVLINRNNGRKGFDNDAFQNRFGGKAGAAMRLTSARLPIKVLHSLSVPSMIGSEKDVYGVVRPKIEENLKKHAEEQAEKILG